MVKVVAMMKRKPGITPDEFARYWYEEHAPLGFDLFPDDIRIVGYVQNYTIRNPADQEPEYDGLVEFVLEDMDAFQRWLAFFMSDAAKPMRDDEKNFMDPDTIKVLVMNERVVVPRDQVEAGVPQ
jgi:uncharacterized protein (TIGR02118 family)